MDKNKQIIKNNAIMIRDKRAKERQELMINAVRESKILFPDDKEKRLEYTRQKSKEIYKPGPFEI